jgi:hypothetical protein
LKTIREELEKSDHLASDSMLKLLLVMAAMSRPVETTAVARFNDILNKVCDCDCSSHLARGATHRHRDAR